MVKLVILVLNDIMKCFLFYYFFVVTVAVNRTPQ